MERRPEPVDEVGDDVTRQNIREMEEGYYWYYPSRGQEIAIRKTTGRMRRVSFWYQPDDDSPIAVSVHRRAKGGFLYAAPHTGDWPEEESCEHGAEPEIIRVCDLPGAWVRIPDPPSKEDAYNQPHWRTPCGAVDTKG
jgi:hypothetical protein